MVSGFILEDCCVKAPARVLIVSIIVSLVVVFIVLYRYDLLPKKSQDAGETAQQTSAPVANSADKPSESENKEAKKETAATGLPSAAQLENGKKLYETATCILCHGATGKADTPTAQALKATNLVEGKFKNNKDNLQSVEYILKVITEGVPGTGMASFKAQVPNESDRRDIAEYVHSLAEKK